VLAAVATGQLPGGVDAPTAEAIGQTMLRGSDRALGVHRYKVGSLDSDPMVMIKTGFFVRGKAKPPLIYVVGLSLTGKPTGKRGAAQRRLDKLTDAVLGQLRAAGATL
jgi:hypothetical protein